jgi:hypothetical protein
MKCMQLVSLVVLGAASSAASAQVTFYDLFYTREHVQETQAPPPPSSRFIFATRITANTVDDIAEAFVTPPIGPRLTLTTTPGSATFLFTAPAAATEAQLLAAFPAGPYLFEITGGMLGDQQTTLTRTANTFWPSVIPAYTPDSFNALNAVNPARDFTLEFNGFSEVPGANISLIFFVIFDQFGQVVYLDVLPNTATSTTIPAGFLLPLTQYNAAIYYSSRFETPGSGFAGATSIVAYDSVTFAALETTAPCLADFNSDGSVDFFDYLDFAAAFEAEDPNADFNGDQIIDFFDYLDFVALFEAGC